MTTPIPQPPPLPLFGNVRDIDPSDPQGSFSRLTDEYGEIYQLSFFGLQRIVINSVELNEEICDDKRFCKAVAGPLERIRRGVGDGLFTAYQGEHNWGVAHRTLVPAFGPIGIHDMFDEMLDIATQLVAKWARVGPEAKIHVTDDFTRLTLDSIALCAMGKRFNSFYSENLHPFVDAMVRFLVEAGKQGSRTRIESWWNPEPERQFGRDIELMKSVAKEVIDYRRANPVEKKDLLNAMLFGKDPKTKERLTDESIMNNMITFLIAGHETTSGLLSFTTYYLLKNPAALEKAQKEVDTVLGQGSIRVDHMSKFPYLEAVLRETLRLMPTAPAFSRIPVPGTTEPVVIGGGKYLIPPGASFISHLPSIHRDPKVYGDDAKEFRPERMYGENFTKLPPAAWKPFGNGARACIGRPFAWQEALMALALVLQNFDLKFVDPNYKMFLKSTLTIKPGDLYIHASLREGIDALNIEKKLYDGASSGQSKQGAVSSSYNPTLTTGKPMLVLYGSNSGTCEGLSQNLAKSAASHGFTATIKPLDQAVDKLPTDQPVIIITASYEGNPPDNANEFVEWLKTVDDQIVKNVHFAVFGCGHHDWVATFQKVPKLIDSELARKGAKQIAPRGQSDVAEGVVFDDFDAWQDEKLWPVLAAGSSPSESFQGLAMELSTNARASHLRHTVYDAQVLKNELLSAPGTPEKRVTEFRLPNSLTYEAGDYLALLPLNPQPTISRVLRHFGLPWDATMKLAKGAHTTIPTEVALSVTNVLAAYVELNSPASRKHIAALAQYTKEGGSIPEPVTPNPSSVVSVLELLEQNHDIKLPFPVFLAMLPPMRIRQYSISSSPLVDATKARIVYSVVTNPVTNGHTTDTATKKKPDPEPPHLGVATNYLKALSPGTAVQVMIKKSHAAFHLPSDLATPIIMICAGTGLAPFLGFVEERAARIAAARKSQPSSPSNPLTVGTAMLFIGCRHPERDRLYASELEKHAANGVVELFYAYSRASASSHGAKYAQDRLWVEREPVRKLFAQGARAYICGSAALGRGVADVVARMVVEGELRKGKTVTEQDARAWWEGLRGERYAVDVFD